MKYCDTSSILLLATAAATAPWMSSAFVALKISPEGRNRFSMHLLSTVNGEEISPTTEIWRVETVDKISDNPESERYPNPLSLKPNTPLSWFVEEGDAVVAKVLIDKGNREQREKRAFTLAGPRLDIAFDPKKCKAAIVTCGGLCPGT